MLLIGWGLLGLLLGLALEPVALRVAGEARAVCPGCGSPQQSSGLLTLARGTGRAGLRCGSCGSWAQLWLAGLGPALAVIFALLAARWQPGWALIAVSLYAIALLLVAVLDLRRRLVYPLLTYPATALAVILTPLALQQPAWSGMAGAMAGAAVFLVLYLSAALLYRGGGALGLGDVMIAGLVGAMTGLSGVIGAMALGIVFGGIGAAAVGIVVRARRAHFAYGPALCLGGLVTLLSAPLH